MLPKDDGILQMKFLLILYVFCMFEETIADQDDQHPWADVDWKLDDLMAKREVMLPLTKLTRQLKYQEPIYYNKRDNVFDALKDLLISALNEKATMPKRFGNFLGTTSNFESPLQMYKTIFDIF